MSSPTECVSIGFKEVFVHMPLVPKSHVLMLHKDDIIEGVFKTGLTF